MASRFPLPSDPQMRMADELTLLRKASNQNGQSKSIAHNPDSAGRRLEDFTVIDPKHAPQRRRFVFTDPVAFRYGLQSKLGTVLR
jgi:hypothetical protein